MPSNYIRARIKPALLASGLRQIRFHDFRHTFGSLKISQGENLKYVQLQMGHASIQITLDTYTHLLEKSNPTAAVKTETLVFGNVEVI